MVKNPLLSNLRVEKVFPELWRLMVTGGLWKQVLPSLKRVGVALLVASLGGIPMGILIGYYRVLEQLSLATFQFLRMISPLAWMPLAIMFLGIGDKPIYFLVFMGAIWPIIINTSHGVGRVEKDWIKIAKNFGAMDWDILKKIIIPAILPDMLTGLRVAVGISWIILVPAEMLGVTSGLGYQILDARDRFAYSEMVAWILIIGAIGYLLDVSLRKLRGRVLGYEKFEIT
ncbi:MAG: ABC transporter permease [Caldiserica bacterium]|nr:ABC transporter permease [Caldisericota bacterium]